MSHRLVWQTAKARAARRLYLATNSLPHYLEKTPLNLRLKTTLSSRQAESLMTVQPGKPKMPASKPGQDDERETRQAVISDADRTEEQDRDLVHGDGGTLGLGSPGDLSHDD
jgi:hypothetical protein